MTAVLLYVVVGGFAWLIVGGLLALGIGAIIRNRDCCLGHPDVDDDLMALVQPENLR